MSVPAPVVDIKNSVSPRLEASGALDQLRAQIRASVYAALLGAHGAALAPQAVPAQPLAVVAEFLKRSGMEQTQEVLCRESGSGRLASRDELAGALGGAVDPADADRSVLEQVLAAAKRRALARSTIHEEPAAAFDRGNEHCR
eukprot:TRINITY_DN63446_c0_g1_i1.p2 TRINITY_DN63446_c0_g1~~TRINITY_DN63446_c0_g1_i1.p2  ORF type:complete len:143 (+),score=36.93 TRINITY_DN63446_c0_g1_i1:121-549(+)